jgi:hypothetical protein
MGHTEMLLAVAGLEDDKIAERCRKLAGGDWSEFSPAERIAFSFARKQAKTPWAVTADDVSRLVEAFGTARALDVIWWSCRCHYMTRVADGFQIPLERENVFQPPKAAPQPEDDPKKPDEPKDDECA